jgi:hypothetical protein
MVTNLYRDKKFKVTGNIQQGQSHTHAHVHTLYSMTMNEKSCE